MYPNANGMMGHGMEMQAHGQSMMPGHLMQPSNGQLMPPQHPVQPGANGFIQNNNGNHHWYRNP